MSQRIHLLASLALGLLLLLSAATGLILAGNQLSEQLQAPTTTDSVAQMAERVAAAVPGIERIERAPSGVLRVAFSTAEDSGVLRVDPASGAVLGSYEPSALMEGLRDLHRDLLLGSAGRWLSGLSALGLLLLSLSGAWLLARRLGGWRRFLLPIAPGRGLAHWHTVVARWTLPVVVVLALSGLYLSAVSLELIASGEEGANYPDAVYAQPAAPLGNLSALRNLALEDLRELEFPADRDEGNYFTLRTATGEGFVNAASGQWISFQRYGLAQRLSETAYVLHTGAGSPFWSLLLAGCSSALLFLTGSGLLAWWQRRRLTGELRGNVPAEQAQVVVLVGSQSGSTWHYARQLLAQLQAAGQRVHVASMNQLQPHYPQARKLVLLAATHGDGQAPDSARDFLQRLEQSPLPEHLHTTVVGFGDSRFQHFCGFARQVAQQLERQGHALALPLQCIDRSEPAALQQLAQGLGQWLGCALQLLPAQPHVALQRLELLSRELYGEESESPAAILRFALQPEPRARGPARLWQRRARFSPGDLLAIRPGEGLAPRFYSIASSDEDGAVEICVRRQPGGYCSGLLHRLQPGDCVEGFIQPHPDFRPAAGRHPVILIGAGTGVAPLIGFVRKNVNQRPLHLYWGGRDPQADFLYGRELESYLAEGRLTGLRLAFSQGLEPCYVQDRLREDAQQLSLLLQQGAQVLVCGSREMAAGVRAVIEPVLQTLGESLEQLRLQGRYREDVY
ncbi:sulfite reductase (NADPH) flavoprotein alpha-component [Pseudomonas fluvialis]|uniref:Sulfite reductase (NADPH) flavoprotein alpha-component n=1 Tax=Pseudomonas fluvialis TaxID=1793966 RepID=A0A7X0BUV4_9PSED|nr:PepSY domain-containing protein [Pseudomonas fluvialis]MBB6343332.1 sulfite reductase (NADPH) flavoprotein alpha-component [Pseudomonas fluvialis]